MHRGISSKTYALGCLHLLYCNSNFRRRRRGLCSVPFVLVPENPSTSWTVFSKVISSRTTVHTCSNKQQCWIQTFLRQKPIQSPAIHASHGQATEERCTGMDFGILPHLQMHADAFVLQLCILCMCPWFCMCVCMYIYIYICAGECVYTYVYANMYFVFIYPPI